MGSLSGRIALVTDGSRGIGRVIAERLARDGALVAVHYGGDEAAAKETAAAIAEAGGCAFLVGAELGSPGGVDALTAALVAGLRAYGESALDVLVHHAALPVVGRPVEAVTAEEFDETVAAHIGLPLLLTQRLLPRLRDGGRIIHVSSGAGARAGTASEAEGIAQALTKAALDAFSHALRRHLGPRGITVNSLVVGRPGLHTWLAPGTGLAPGAQTASDAVAYLASDAAHWLTGARVDVPGVLGP
ncbi:SDR family oxidoreductase [Streptomyces sp. G45]|uniref:SDR family oxidoreductase n=1 Tax=Streptomyces sp. G45 TaxID=3406627 RepID=UPI003C16B15F